MPGDISVKMIKALPMLIWDIILAEKISPEKKFIITPLTVSVVEFILILV